MDFRQSIYEVFNARNMRPEEVAKTFVPSRDFFRLLSASHSVLMGPRGSGKTTLLKMLTLPALKSWSHESAVEVLARLPFTAIYIPTDVHWHHELRDWAKALEDLPVFQRRFSSAAVTVNVLGALRSAIEARVKYEQGGSRGVDPDICRAMINEWLLPPTIPSFTSV